VDAAVAELTYLFQDALKHKWLSGESATEHNLLPEIKAYMAKARLRRGIELVKLANRIESLKMQEDDPENSDMHTEAALPLQKITAAAAAQNDGASGGSSAESGPSDRTKQTIQKVKGAIFREVVLAKVREMRQQEEVRKEVEEASKQGSP
jgi:calcium/calmodulin-dependent protein kinase I